MTDTPTRRRRIAVPGAAIEQAEQPAEQAVESGLPKPDQIDSSKISRMVLTSEGWVAGTNVPGGGR